MSQICPKDFKVCIDDLCRSCGSCMRTGDDMLERCRHCGNVIADRYCGCDGEMEEYWEEWDRIESQREWCNEEGR